MTINKLRMATAAIVVVAGMTMSNPASAAGCNGVVDWFKWGCAGWDNNNGPQYPYYQKKVVTVPKQGTQIVDKNGAKFALRNGQYFPLVTQAGGNIISDNGGGFQVWSQ